MQYIQLKPQDASLVPTPTEAGNVNYFLDLNTNLPKFKTSDGQILEISGAPNIPKPIVAVHGVNNNITVSFKNTQFDFTQPNIELFLFRWKNNRRKKVNSIVKKNSASWVHPATEGWETKWAGWNYFGGDHNYKDKDNLYATIIHNRITEFAVPTTLVQNLQFDITFNRYMFWNKIDLINSIAVFDDNFIEEQNSSDITTITNFASIGSGKNKTKIIKYSLALAIDNPLATKTNGLCPKIFGEFSDPFYSVLKKQSGVFIDIELKNYLIEKHLRVFKPSK